MKKKILAISTATAILLSVPFFANADDQQPVFNQVSLTAEGETVVQQDYLTITLVTKVQGNSNKEVQQKLTENLNEAVKDLKSKIKDDNFSLKTGQFSIYPEYTNNTISGWQGNASIIIEGKDFNTMSEAAPNVNKFSIVNSNFSVSESKMKELKSETVKKAIDNFKSQSTEVAKGFGFDSYRIQSVNITYDERYPTPIYNRVMMAKAEMVADAPAAPPVSFESGKTTIKAVINGSIILNSYVQ